MAVNYCLEKEWMSEGNAVCFVPHSCFRINNFPFSLPEHFVPTLCTRKSDCHRKGGTNTALWQQLASWNCPSFLFREGSWHYSALPRPGTPISCPHEEVGLSCLCRIHGVCPGLRPIIEELGNGQNVSCGSKPQSHKRPLKLLISNRVFCFPHPLDGWSEAWSGDMALWNPIFWSRKP